MIKEKLPGIKQFDLTGMSAIITGGSRGLGFAMAEGLASAGANIMIVNRSKEEGNQAAQELVDAYGIKAITFECDVTNQAQVEAMTNKGISTFGKIDVLINSAGINVRGPIDEVAPSDFQKVLDVNVNGTWLCCRAITPHMKKNKSGRIINLASTLGLVGLANRTPYASSKGAIVQMTKALAIELAQFNITVNAICPGPFLTEMNKPIADSEDAKKNIIGATALGRWGELKEIQGAAIYLASEASSYTTGSMMVVDGGWTAR